MQFKILDSCLFIMNLYGVHPAKVGDKTQTFVFIFYLIQFSVLICLIILFMIKKESMPFEEKFDVGSRVLIEAHVLLYLICLYVQRRKLQLLIEYMKQHFWDPENHTSPEVKISCKKTLRLLRTKFYTYILFMALQGIICCYGRIIVDGRQISENLSYDAYIPPGVNFWAMFAWEQIPAFGTLNMLTCMDFCICSIISSTALQFRLLRYEVETLFDGFEEDDQNGYSRQFEKKFRKCNHHYDFLISFTTMAVETFSMLMFIYLGVVILTLCIETYVLFCATNWVNVMRVGLYTVLIYLELFACFCYPSQELLDEAIRSMISYSMFLRSITGLD